MTISLVYEDHSGYKSEFGEEEQNWRQKLLEETKRNNTVFWTRILAVGMEPSGYISGLFWGWIE